MMMPNQAVAQLASVTIASGAKAMARTLFMARPDSRS